MQLSWPVRQVEWASELSTAHAVELLRSELELGVIGLDRGRTKSSSRPFVGYREGAACFLIARRRRWGGHVNPPLFRVHILRYKSGCAVRLRLRPHAVEGVFMSVWFGGLSYAVGTGCLRACETGRLWGAHSPFHPLAMIVIAFASLNLVYSVEFAQTQALLRKLIPPLHTA